MILAFFILVSRAIPAMGQTTLSHEEQAKRLLIGLSAKDGPGIQYFLVNKEVPLFSFCSGLADIKNGIPLTPVHTLSAFSMTKTLTAIAVLQLVERQEINLDDRISKYVDHPYSREITIRHLLTHTAGLPNPIPLRWVHLASDHLHFDENKALAKILADHPKSEGLPGEKYLYSNIGYWLLGRVIEAASGQSYPDYVRKNIFQPLRLTGKDIDFTITDYTLQAKGYLEKYSLMNLAKGFLTDRKVWGAYEGSWLHIKEVYVDGPSFGGAIGSARAFSLILQHLLKDHSNLLNDQSRRLLFSQQKTRTGAYIDMTLGWHIGVLEGSQYFYKEGGGAGYHGEMRVYPSRGLASVIMTNKTSFNSRGHLSAIDKLFFQK